MTYRAADMTSSHYQGCITLIHHIQQKLNRILIESELHPSDLKHAMTMNAIAAYLQIVLDVEE